jgi:HSP20 family protein
MTRLTRTRNLSSLQNEIDRVFDRFFPSAEDAQEGTSRQPVWRPRMDLLESDETYRLHLDMPGMRQEDLTIRYQNDELVISGERERPHTDEDEEFVRAERSVGQFRRAFTLPRTIDAEGIRATYESGVLTVTVPKAEAVQPRRIEIQ